MIDPYHQRAGHPARRSPPPCLPCSHPLLFYPLPASCPILDAFISLANFRFCIILGLGKASKRLWSSLRELLSCILHQTTSLRNRNLLRIFAPHVVLAIVWSRERGIPFCGRHQRYHRDRGPLLLRGVRPGIVVAAAVQHVGFRLRDSLASREGGNAMAIVIPF